MTETTELPTTRNAASGLSGMVLPELKALAGRLGIKGTSGMRKGDLVAAIAAHQAGSRPAQQHTGNGSANGSAGSEASNGAAVSGNGTAANGTAEHPDREPRGRRVATRRAGAPDGQPALTDVAPGSFDADSSDADASHGSANGRSTTNGATSTSGSESASTASGRSADDSSDGTVRATRSDERPGVEPTERDGNRRNRRNRRDRGDGDASRTGDGCEPAVRNVDDAARPQASTQTSTSTDGRTGQPSQSGQSGPNRASDRDGGRQDFGPNRQQDANQTRSNDRQNDARTDSRQGDSRPNNASDNRPNNASDNRPNNASDRRDDDDGDGRRRGRRFRDRNRRGRERTATDGGEPEVREDDVLVPIAGIVDVLDSYAFIRTSGYLAGSNDVYVSLSQVRKYGLRRGDKVTGAIRASREGEPTQQRQKFNPLVRLDTINELDPELSRGRPEFTKLTPLYPNQRLRLETESHLLTTRLIDLVMPVGKGQRALIVSPPKAGKTMVMQAIANAITTNNPEVHLMVVLVDERPEEVTDMQRSVKGEVIASTFDRPPADHTMVAELSIERAKRLVEMGRDVVVLLDSITRLGRAYNLAAPASGRILSGGVDSTALFPPKRFLGAARNIENGGSLTIFASALVETGSAGDTVIFEEFKGTGNAELKLDRRLADKRIFPAIDIDASSTRKEDLLLSPDELAITVKLRRLLSALEAQPALELVLERLRKTRTNVEFLLQVAKNMPIND